MTKNRPNPLTYKDSGVDIEAGDALVDAIRPIVARTLMPGCLGTIGGFGGLFELPAADYRQPVLVSGTDGVGTKLKLAIELGRHDTVGVDLVAMCVNDVVVSGAQPLFFLDYFATGHLEPEIAVRVVDGIARGCEIAGAALIGGETAEMPGMYSAGDYDLAGFCVGIVEKQAIINGSGIRSGDQIIGVASSGPHSNGYSLIRAIVERSNADLSTAIGSTTLADALMAPTRIYVRPVLEVAKTHSVNALAHITGGGLPGNLSRPLPDNVNAIVRFGAWEMPEIFHWLREQGQITDEEMLKTFNCGIGMTLVVPSEHAANTLRTLETWGENAFLIGEVVPGNGEVVIV